MVITILVKKKRHFKNYVETQMNQETLNKSMQSTLASLMASTIKKNASNISNMLTQENKINLSNTDPNMSDETKQMMFEKCGPVTVNITDIVQMNDADLATATKKVSDAKNDLKSEMRNDIASGMEQMSGLANSENIGTTIGEMGKAAFEALGNFGSDVADVFSHAGGGAGIGNKYNENIVREKSKEFNNKYGIDENTSLVNENHNEVDMESKLTDETMENILNEVMQANGIDASVLCATSFNVERVEQLNSANIKVESETINTISNTVGNQFVSNIDTMLESISSKANDTIKGDIAQLGVAADLTIRAGGDAVATCR